MIQAAVDEALAANPDVAEKIRGGKVAGGGRDRRRGDEGDQGSGRRRAGARTRTGRLQLRASAPSRPSAATRVGIQPLTRVRLRVVDREPAQHLGERQHGVGRTAHGRGRRSRGSSAMPAFANCSAWCTIADRVSRSAFAVLAAARCRGRSASTASASGFPVPPRETPTRSRHRHSSGPGPARSVGHRHQHLIERAPMLAVAASADTSSVRVENAVYSTGFPTPAASATASMLSSCNWQSAEHGHRGVQQLLAALFTRQARSVLAPLPGSGHAGNITPPLYSRRRNCYGGVVFRRKQR